MLMFSMYVEKNTKFTILKIVNPSEPLRCPICGRKCKTVKNKPETSLGSHFDIYHNFKNTPIAVLANENSFYLHQIKNEAIKAHLGGDKLKNLITEYDNQLKPTEIPTDSNSQ